MIIRMLIPILNFILDMIVTSFFGFPAFIISIFYLNYQIFFKKEYIFYKNYYQLFFFFLEMSIFSNLKIISLIFIYVLYFLLSIFLRKYILFNNILYIVMVFAASISMHYFIIFNLKKITIFSYLFLCFIFYKGKK
jgi:hypothetical protein